MTELSTNCSLKIPNVEISPLLALNMFYLLDSLNNVIYRICKVLRKHFLLVSFWNNQKWTFRQYVLAPYKLRVRQNSCFQIIAENVLSQSDCNICWSLLYSKLMDESVLLQADKHPWKEQIFLTAIFDRPRKVCPCKPKYGQDF